MKNVTIVKGMGGAHHDLVIQPGTTPQDICQQVGLDGSYVLRKLDSHEPFAATENVYEQIQDGSKLVATTPIEVGLAA
jgi:hypothetical protein